MPVDIEQEMKQKMKQKIEQEAAGFVAAENRQFEKALWQTPLVGFADAKSGYIKNLKKIVHPNHQMPEEVLPGASIVIAYYVPFTRWLPESNSRGMEGAPNRSGVGIAQDRSGFGVVLSRSGLGNASNRDGSGMMSGSGGRDAAGRSGAESTSALSTGERAPAFSIHDDAPAISMQELASSEWAQGYELTNAMFDRLNEHLIDVVHKLGYEAKTASEANIFHRDQVISYWSFRHFAYAAGLGTFGRNNMLITEKGCCGRCNTVVTTLDVTPDQPQTEEACLFFRDGRCGLCIKKCPSKALTAEGFDRQKCFAQCLKNAAVYDSFGSSYGAEGGSEVCGKCLCGLPCTNKRP